MENMEKIFKISFEQKFDRKNWSVVVNCGEKIRLSDGTYLDKFESGSFKDIKFSGDKLLIFEIGDNLEVSQEIADFCKKNWAQVYELYPDIKEFKGTEFYRSPKVKLGNLEFNFWYCKENFSCRIHQAHDFFEIHTQILGKGEMQKFFQNDENTIYYRDILSPGQTHKPFFDTNCSYPWHRYYSNSKCIWLAVESPNAMLLKGE